MCCTQATNTTFFIEIEPILNELDDLIASNSTPSSELLDLCSNALRKVSIVYSDQAMKKLDRDTYRKFQIGSIILRWQAEKLIPKLKELSSRLVDREQGFIRDRFLVTSNERNAEYLIEGIEFYSEVQFYPNSNRMMKLFEWKVYKSPVLSSDLLDDEYFDQLQFVLQYNLEKSQSEDGIPTYVFGRTNMEDRGHVSFVNYGTEPGPTFDGYYRMKLLVIQDLTTLKGLPVRARTIRNFETDIDVVIVYGYQRYLWNNLGIEVDDDVFYEDDKVVYYDTRTGQMIDDYDS